MLFHAVVMGLPAIYSYDSLTFHKRCKEELHGLVARGEQALVVKESKKSKSGANLWVSIPDTDFTHLVCVKNGKWWDLDFNQEMKEGAKYYIPYGEKEKFKTKEQVDVRIDNVLKNYQVYLQDSKIRESGELKKNVEYISSAMTEEIEIIGKECDPVTGEWASAPVVNGAFNEDAKSVPPFLFGCLLLGEWEAIVMSAETFKTLGLKSLENISDLFKLAFGDSITRFQVLKDKVDADAKVAMFLRDLVVKTDQVFTPGVSWWNSLSKIDQGKYLCGFAGSLVVDYLLGKFAFEKFSPDFISRVSKKWNQTGGVELMQKDPLPIEVIWKESRANGNMSFLPEYKDFFGKKLTVEDNLLLSKGGSFTDSQGRIWEYLGPKTEKTYLREGVSEWEEFYKVDGKTITVPMTEQEHKLHFEPDRLLDKFNKSQ